MSFPKKTLSQLFDFFVNFQSLHVLCLRCLLLKIPQELGRILIGRCEQAFLGTFAYFQVC